ICGPGIDSRWPDLADGAQLRQPGDVLRDVIPALSAVAGIPELPVVGAGPDQSALNLRWRDREHERAVELTEVVLDDPAGGNDDARVTRRQIRTDDAPCLPGIGGLEDHLAAIVDRLRIEGIDRERRRPVTAIGDLVWRRIERVNSRTD